MSTNIKDAAAGMQTVRAWDGPTRLFHWLLVASVVAAYVTRHWGDAELRWHTWNGYAVLVLVVWRIMWGFVGSSTARFRAFFYWPWQAASYGIDFLLRRPRHFLGHNPLGGNVVFVLLGLVGAMGLLGLFAYDDHDANAGGPLASKVSDPVWALATKLHMQLFDVLMIVIVLHVAANILYRFWKGENLVRAMITGHKPAQTYEDQQEAKLEGVGRALVCLVAAVLLVFGGIMTAGGKP
ncbi:MAG: cytochrome b/b6 domain-containing protein [Hyphomicrobiaceae bacterium]